MENLRQNWMLLAALALVVFSSAVIAFYRLQPAEAQTAGGPGLKAQYFDTKTLSDRKLTRTDLRIDFFWGKGSPSRRVQPDTFSARWTGKIEAPETGKYTFHVHSSDGVRLWVNGRLVVGNWRDQSPSEQSGGLSLEAGKRYDIKLEYYENRGRAAARLAWSGPGFEKRVVPQSRLFLPGTPDPEPPSPTPQCSDGHDNDSDGKTDHPADPGCVSHDDDSENPDPEPQPEPPAGMERWSEPATWGGEVPRDGEAVTIPRGKTVLLDRSVSLRSLQIDGTLVFEDEKDLELRSDWIMVHGKLRIGSEAEPFQHEATITLTNATPNEDVMNMGDKLIGVMGGTLEVHGAKTTSWTRLTSTANKGASRLSVQDASGWRVGDEVVVASTDYDSRQAEERKVMAVADEEITLDRPLEYQHFGRLQTFAGRSVDERAEVARLSRNVTIRGDAASSVSGFGGQIMAMDMRMEGMTMPAVVRIEGAELTRMGQKNILRRYPLHFHMLGAGGANSYLKNTSIHETYNRCVTVHGTDNLSLSNNVCHDHLGHGYFFEDGAENDNVLTDNLGLTTRDPGNGNRLLPSDDSPATFWITNPDNILRGNVAAGSEGNGFWLAFPEHPTGISTDPNVWPRRTPLGEFSGNTAHSNQEDGLNVDGGPRPDGKTEATVYAPRQNPADKDSAPVVADFEGFTAYKNRNHGVWLRGRDHVLSGATLADNWKGATFASAESFLRGSLLVGETVNLGNPSKYQIDKGYVGTDGRSLPQPWNDSTVKLPIRGFEFYDGRVGAEDSTFVNFQPDSQRQASALGYKLGNGFPIHPGNFASGLRFENANRVYLPDPEPGKDGDASAVFLDRDGSVTGTAGGMVAADNPFLLNPSCSLRQEWNAHVCDAEYVSLGVKSQEEPGDIKPVRLIRSDGTAQTLRGCCADSNTAWSSVFAAREYEVEFSGGSDGALPQEMEFVLARGKGQWVRLSIPYEVEPQVTRWGCDLANNRSGQAWCRGKTASLEELNGMSKSGYYYDAREKRLYLRIFAEHDWEELKVRPKP